MGRTGATEVELVPSSLITMVAYLLKGLNIRASYGGTG